MTCGEVKWNGDEVTDQEVCTGGEWIYPVYTLLGGVYGVYTPSGTTIWGYHDMIQGMYYGIVHPYTSGTISTPTRARGYTIPYLQQIGSRTTTWRVTRPSPGPWIPGVPPHMRGPGGGTPGGVIPEGVHQEVVQQGVSPGGTQ